MLTLQEWSLIVIMSCTIITSVVAILSFNRNRKFDNENTLFKLKIEGYYTLCDKMMELADLLNESLELIDHAELHVDEMFERAEEVYEVTNKLFNQALKHGILFPELVIEELNKLEEKARPVKERYDEPEKMENLLVLHDNRYEDLLTQIDVLYEAMRKDVGSEKLNKSLSRRIH